MIFLQMQAYDLEDYPDEKMEILRQMNDYISYEES